MATTGSIEALLRRYQAILASTLDPVVVIDARGVIETASRSVERVLGWSPEELVGRNISVLMPDPWRADHDGYLERYRRTGETNILGRTRELRAQRRDGTVIPIELSVSRVDLPGREEPIFTGIIHDISERRLAEEELAAHRERLEELVLQRTRQLEATHEQLRLADRLAAVGTLAAGLGHDMHNVLLPVRCRLDNLDAMGLSPVASEQLVAIRRSVEYLQHLSDGLHLMALDPDDAAAAADATDLHEWWTQAGPLLSRAVPKSARFRAEIPDALPPVGVPSHRLTQAVLNLIVNAAEAIDTDGSVVLRISAFPDGRFVEVVVEDDGHGMPPEVRRRALEPFFTTKKRGLGTGLGLSLVHGVATAAGGMLEIDTAPGRGTRVRLVFPVARRRPLDGDDGAPRVGLAIGEPRLAGLVEALLVANGCAGDVADPYGGSALVTDQPKVARAGVLGGRPVLVLGGTVSGAALCVPDPEDFEELRGAIHDLALRLHSPEP